MTATTTLLSEVRAWVTELDWVTARLEVPDSADHDFCVDLYHAAEHIEMTAQALKDLADDLEAGIDDEETAA